MADSNLDWKKVFKKIILGDTELLDDNANSFDPKDHCVSESVNKITSGTPEEFQNADCRRQILKTTENLNEKAIENSTVNSKVPEWNKVFKNILGDNKRPRSCETTTVSSVQCSSHSYGLHSNRKPVLSDHASHKSNLHSSRKPVQSDYASHKSKQIHNTRHPHMPMNSYVKYKSKKQSEEESYLEKVLALSQMFKPADKNYKLNDFDGSGVNVFKSAEPTGNEYSNDDSNTYKNPHKISQTNKHIYFCPKDNFEDSHEQNAKNYKDTTCPGGWVATKPYTYEDMISVKCVTVSEVWDEDLCI